jgi:hypothetical protein
MLHTVSAHRLIENINLNWPFVFWNYGFDYISVRNPTQTISHADSLNFLLVLDFE